MWTDAFADGERGVRKSARSDKLLFVQNDTVFAKHVLQCLDVKRGKILRHRRGRSCGLSRDGAARDRAHHVPERFVDRGAAPRNGEVLDLLAVERTEGHLIDGTALFPVGNQPDGILRIGMHLGVGIALCFGYIMLGRVFEQIALGGSLAPWLGVWLPNIIFSFIAFVVYIKAPK